MKGSFETNCMGSSARILLCGLPCREDPIIIDQPSTSFSLLTYIKAGNAEQETKKSLFWNMQRLKEWGYIPMRIGFHGLFRLSLHSSVKIPFHFEGKAGKVKPVSFYYPAVSS
jgi:hypothetical protein